MGENGLPIMQNGIVVREYPDFYWQVTANPTLGAETFFNVEARGDEYTLEEDEQIQDLALIRRQVGDEAQNQYTLVSAVYDNFLLQNPEGGEEPVVVAEQAQALLGPQGTIFTFGLQGDAPVDPEEVFALQVVHEAPQGAVRLTFTSTGTV